MNNLIDVLDTYIRRMLEAEAKATPDWSAEQEYVIGQIVGGRPNGEVIGRFTMTRKGWVYGGARDAKFAATARNLHRPMLEGYLRWVNQGEHLITIARIFADDPDVARALEELE